MASISLASNLALELRHFYRVEKCSLFRRVEEASNTISMLLSRDRIFDAVMVVSPDLGNIVSSCLVALTRI
jgi:hypothetical protein